MTLKKKETAIITANRKKRKGGKMGAELPKKRRPHRVSPRRGKKAMSSSVTKKLGKGEKKDGNYHKPKKKGLQLTTSPRERGGGKGKNGRLTLKNGTLLSKVAKGYLRPSKQKEGKKGGPPVARLTVPRKKKKGEKGEFRYSWGKPIDAHREKGKKKSFM